MKTVRLENGEYQTTEKVTEDVIIMVIGKTRNIAIKKALYVMKQIRQMKTKTFKDTE